MTAFAASPRAGLRRRWWPLAVSLAVHALLAGLWVRHVDRRPVAVETPEPLTVLVLPAPSPRRVPSGPPAPRDQRDEKTARKKLPESAPVVAMPAAPPVPAPVQEVAPSAQPSAADILAAARRDIGKFDREPGGGKLGGKSDDALRPAESKWDRFAQSLSAAHVDSGPPEQSTYTSPDGTVYYRTKAGNRYYCRKTGTLDPSSTWKTGREMHANSMSTLGMGGTAGLVECPGSERDWKRQ